MTPARVVLLLLLLLCQGFATSAAASPPSPLSPWTKRDYVDFYFSHYNGHVPLPHLRDPAAKALFERMVDRENLRFIASDDVSLADRQRHIAMILMTMGEIRAAYNYAVLVGEPLQEELARVQAFTLAALDAAIRLSPAASDRREAWATTYLGVVQSLGERNTYSNIQLASLSAALAHHYPAVSPVLSAADRHDIERRIVRLLTAEADPALRTAYAQLLQTIAAN